MKTENANGQISAYGFACGRTMHSEKNYKSVSMWAQHGVYFVREIDTFHGTSETKPFRTLTEARPYYARCVRLARFTA